jgi:hypothetical protein
MVEVESGIGGAEEFMMEFKVLTYFQECKTVFCSQFPLPTFCLSVITFRSQITLKLQI